MPKRRQPSSRKRPATPAAKTVMPMIMTPAHRKRLLELIERFDELETRIQNDSESDLDKYEMEEEQNEIFESVFAHVREMLGIPSPNKTGELS